MRTIEVPDWAYDAMCNHLAKLERNKKTQEFLDRFFAPARERHEEAKQNGCRMLVGSERCGEPIENSCWATYCPEHAPID